MILFKVNNGPDLKGISFNKDNLQTRRKKMEQSKKKRVKVIEMIYRNQPFLYTEPI